MRQILIFFTIILFMVACETTTVRKTSESTTELSRRGIVGIKSNSPTHTPRIVGIKPNSPTHTPLLALVIGNAEYEYSSLRNPVNDANDIADVLEEIGFNVILKTNLNQVAMNKALSEFSTLLSNQPGVGLFYFAGHGSQVEGQNYLLPIDNKKIVDEYNLKAYAVNADDVLARMVDAKNHLNIIVLDACRDNPFRGFRNLRRGLAHMSPSMGSIIAFATAPGKTAADASIGGRNGLFTKYLIDGLKRAHQTHQRIDDMFMEVRNSVLKESEEKQEPWHYSSLRMPFCFGGCNTGTSIPVESQPVSMPSFSSQPMQFSSMATVSMQQPLKPMGVSPLPSYRYIDNGDGTVTDKKTGLIWLKNANCFGKQDWKTSMQSTVKLAHGQCGLRDRSKIGKWRLPTKEEWETMINKKYVDRQNYNQPALSNAASTGPWKEGDAFSGVRTSIYWSSTTSMSFAWYVNLKVGIVNIAREVGTFYVWPVRGRH